jgi:hypothetical protein
VDHATHIFLINSVSFFLFTRGHSVINYYVLRERDGLDRVRVDCRVAVGDKQASDGSLRTPVAP